MQYNEKTLHVQKHMHVFKTNPASCYTAHIFIPMMYLMSVTPDSPIIHLTALFNRNGCRYLTCGFVQ